MDKARRADDRLRCESFFNMRNVQIVQRSFHTDANSLLRKLSLRQTGRSSRQRAARSISTIPRPETRRGLCPQCSMASLTSFKDRLQDRLRRESTCRFLCPAANLFQPIRLWRRYQ